MPSYEGFMLPLLEALAHKTLAVPHAAEAVADRLQLEPSDRTDRPAWAHEPLVVARTRVAAEWLGAAKLVERDGETLSLAARGRALLSEKPSSIDRERLRQFPEFEAYLQAHLARQGA